MEKSKIALKYLKSTFILDFVPLISIIINPGIKSPRNDEN